LPGHPRPRARGRAPQGRPVGRRRPAFGRAMTGEITLRGRAWPIDGLKEKLLAALRGGIKTVLIPEENVKDLPRFRIASRARSKSFRSRGWRRRSTIRWSGSSNQSRVSRGAPSLGRDGRGRVLDTDFALNKEETRLEAEARLGRKKARAAWSRLIFSPMAI
jgi:hypothetical protein